MMKVIFAVLALMLSAGCIGAESLGPHFGELTITTSDATSSYSVFEGVANAQVTASIRGNDTGRIVASAFLVGAPCPIGPMGEPDGWLARADATLSGFGSTPTAEQVEIHVRGAVGPGERYSVIFTAEAENTIGPIFGTCKDLVATP